MDRLASMRVLVKVVDEGSFAAAARSLDMAPASVTRMIGDLEQDLGARVLHRTTRRISLTEVGLVFLERVRTILADIDEAYEVVTTETHSLKGRLTVQAPPVLARNIAGPALASFIQLHPDLHVDIDSGTEELQPLANFDVTLFAVSEPFDANIVARRIVKSHNVLVAAPSYLRKHGIPLTPLDLRQHKILQLKSLLIRSGTLRLMKESDIKTEIDLAQSPLIHGKAANTSVSEDDRRSVVELQIEPIISSNNIETLLDIAVRGGGIVPAAIHLVADLVANGDLVRVVEPWTAGRLGIYAALPSGRFIPRRARAFLDHLVQTVSELDEKFVRRREA